MGLTTAEQNVLGDFMDIIAVPLAILGVPLFDMLLAEPDIQNGDYNIHWLEKWLAAQFGE